LPLPRALHFLRLPIIFRERAVEKADLAIELVDAIANRIEHFFYLLFLPFGARNLRGELDPLPALRQQGISFSFALTGHERPGGEAHLPIEGDDIPSRPGYLFYDTPRLRNEPSPQQVLQQGRLFRLHQVRRPSDDASCVG